MTMTTDLSRQHVRMKPVRRYAGRSRRALTTAAALIAAVAAGRSHAAPDERIPSDDAVLSDINAAAPYLQCVPYARQISGIRIFGDAWTWWDQAEGRYRRGDRPRVGAVMAFPPFRNMRLGHVAVVGRILDRRRLLLRHANWSPINGVRGQIEDNVLAMDVSEKNDWSEARIWFAPLQDLGSTHWPVTGFIYRETPRRTDLALDRQKQRDSLDDLIARLQSDVAAERAAIRARARHVALEPPPRPRAKLKLSLSSEPRHAQAATHQ